FQAIGLDRASIYVKGLLGLIEYPPGSYERIVTVVATSEGISKREIGRHRWADILPIWNMSREGFKQLYDQIPGEKPGFEEVWRITGGNPKMLANLYKAGWDVEEIVEKIIRMRGVDGFIASLEDVEKALLLKAIEDPDVLMSREGISLLRRLVELNLLVDSLYSRKSTLWVDEPPPDKDPEIGIGKHVAWQTPLHREAIRKALEIRS
ncbi:MAG: ATP-binding protein, partial [Sulfolobales archaeon]